MNIVLTFDNNYTSHAAVVIISLCKNNIGCHHFHVITDYISEQNKGSLTTLVQSLGCNISFYAVNIKLLKDFPIGPGTTNTYVTLATYYRLFMIDILPQEVNKILYLDCDIVINGKLDRLWNWEFSSNACIAAVEEQYKLGKKRAKALGYQESYSYFNAGVLLIDMTKIRRIYSIKKAIEYIKQNMNKIQFHDQDVLNALFYDKKDFFPLTFNVLDIFLLRKSTIPSRYLMELEDLKNPIIIHYSGPLKPWHRECIHPLKELYNKYLNQTIWKNNLPSYKYKTKLARCSHYLKTLIRKKLYK